MRIDLVIDGDCVGRVDLTCRPSVGELIQFKTDLLEIDEVRHDVDRNRLSAWCSKRTPASTEHVKLQAEITRRLEAKQQKSQQRAEPVPQS